ncbi:hypothetical protein FKG94_15905 [Exilibacterium tricleocarpae]|uniref:Uncharacterized protein n=1 Tax=Exilibacterium tricleocarpae TaxID=2591008 RepID=A0A545TBC6_9GAMM|nr:hypothetical protein [Exilibacterium tricleocarpae]TQV74501.1 hypothetical protein FKG94_15905 [Exilibacterium tricleocarpae]
MKIKFLAIVAFLFIGAHSAYAQMFGWHGSVTFTNGVNDFDVTFSGPTYSDCESQRGLVKSLYSPPTYSVVSEIPCISLYIDPRVFAVPEVKIPLPDPGCESCPYLREDLIELIYPRNFEKVKSLVDEYRIQQYNEALETLNSQFDLEGFAKQMYFLEKEIGQVVKQ